ncbi:PAS domain S-box protein [Geitlerinema splendidum]|nr:PAS domain S-box protein [Geitlerinema splendidum]
MNCGGASSNSIAPPRKNNKPKPNSKAFFNLSLDLLCVVNFAGEFKRINSAFATGLGYTQAEIIAQTVSDLVHPDDRDRTAQALEQLSQGQLIVNFENRYRTKNGEYRWLAWKARPLIEDRLIYAIARDITERKRLESQHLQRLADETAARIQIANILESITDAFFALDRQWRFTYLNRQAELLLQRQRDELLGKNLWEEFPEAINNDFYTQYHRALTEQISITFTEFYPPLDGWFLVRVYPSSEGLSVYFQDITASKQAEVALRQSEERYRLLFESNPQPMWVNDIETLQFLAINQAAIQHYGYSRAEFLSMSIKDIRPPEDIPRLVETVANRAPGMTEAGIWRHRKKDGTLIDVEISTHSLNFSGRRAEIVLASDVTQRRQAEAQLLEITLLQQTILNAANYTIISTDIDGIIHTFNTAAERLLGYSAEEVVGKQTPILIHDRQEVIERAAQLSEELQTPIEPGFEVFITKPRRGVPEEGEWTYIRKDGSRFPVRLSVTPLQDSQGQITGFLGIASDITQRKQDEEQIRQQAALLDIATDAIFVQSLDREILFWNKAAERLYGYPAAEILGKEANFLYQETLGELEEAQQHVLDKGDWYGELEQLTQAGRKIIVESRWTLVRDEENQPQSILIVNTDITEQKQLAAQFFRIQRLESIGTLASGIAHDLNNLLTPMLAVAQLLPYKIPNLDERTQQLLKIIETNTKRGADLVKQVLSFAKGIEGKHSIIQLEHLAWEISQVASETFPKSIEIQTDLPPDLLPVFGDATQLHQVLINLCLNARDAMPEGGVLSLSAKNMVLDENYVHMNLEAKVGHYVVVTISDTGIGIAPDIMDRIFEPFFTTKETGKGTGLGLSTVMGIVKSHGGFINVYSEVKQGTKFKIYLPALEGEKALIGLPQLLPKGNGELILVADDEAAIREVVKASLETYNYQVLTASDGIEALALYAQYKDKVSVVLMDMMMPSMEGPVAIRTLQKINSKVKVVAVSGLSSSNLVNAARNVGIQEFLAKPFTSEELLLALHRILSA